MTTNTQFALLDLHRTLSNARAYGEMWWLLDGEHPERARIVEASKVYWGFFEPTPRAFFTAFIISLTSVFDAGTDCITLRSIPEMAADPAFSSLWDRGRILYKYRSKAIAHRDVKNDSIDFAKVTGFTYNQIRGISNESCDLYDRYALPRRFEPIFRPQPSSAENLLSLIRKVAE